MTIWHDGHVIVFPAIITTPWICNISQIMLSKERISCKISEIHIVNGKKNFLNHNK